MSTLKLPLPPGTPNDVNLSFTPTWLFTPSTNATNNVRLWNNGQNVVYVGQADVTVNTGLPITPGGRPVELVNVLTSLYAISAVAVGSLLGTVQTAATAGTTTLTWTSSTPTTSLPVGSAFILGSTVNTSNQEVLVVATSASTTSNTTTNVTVFEHDTTNVVYAATPTYGQIRVSAGVI